VQICGSDRPVELSPSTAAAAAATCSLSPTNGTHRTDKTADALPLLLLTTAALPDTTALPLIILLILVSPALVSPRHHRTSSSIRPWSSAGSIRR
jgi:hypothetical protein